MREALVLLFLLVGALAVSARAQVLPGSVTCGSGQTLIYLDPPGVYECVTEGGSGGGSSSGGSSGGGVTATGSGSLDGVNEADPSVGGVMSGFAKWLLRVLLYIPRWCWQQILAGLGALVTAIPVPDAVAVWTSNLSGLASGVVWFLDLLQFKTGLTLVAGALLARFILRRIPLIG